MFTFSLVLSWCNASVITILPVVELSVVGAVDVAYMLELFVVDLTDSVVCGELCGWPDGSV